MAYSNWAYDITSGLSFEINCNYYYYSLQCNEPVVYWSLPLVTLYPKSQLLRSANGSACHHQVILQIYVKLEAYLS